MDRERQSRWDAANLKTVSTKLTRREWAEFYAACIEQGATPYAVVKRMVRAWLQQGGD
jgi:hypothetical protein